MRQKTDGLTKKQKEVLEFIKQFHAEYKYPPSIRQICSAINLSSPATVHVHINHLVEKGFIKRSSGGNKALELLVPNQYENVSEEVIKVPFLKRKNTTNPLDLIAVPNKFYSIPTSIISKKEVFVLTVEEEIERLNLKDIAIIERCKKAKPSEIVAIANNNNEVLLRKLEFNEETDSFNISKNETIIGKVIGLYRKF